MVDPGGLGGSSLSCVHNYMEVVFEDKEFGINIDQQGDLWLGMKGGLSIQVETPRYFRSKKPGGI